MKMVIRDNIYYLIYEAQEICCFANLKWSVGITYVSKDLYKIFTCVLLSIYIQKLKVALK